MGFIPSISPFREPKGTDLILSSLPWSGVSDQGKMCRQLTPAIPVFVRAVAQQYP